MGVADFLSPKALKYRGRRGEAVEEDRPCSHCGYNLRGLRYGQSCPECGGANDPEIAITDVMLEGGEEERARWRRGLGLAALCILIALLARLAYNVFGVVFAVRGGVDDVLLLYICVGAVNAFLWAAAVFLITPVTLVQRWPWMERPRMIARVLTLAFLVGYACLVLRETAAGGPAASGPGMWLNVGSMGGRLLGAAGVMFVAFILHRVAEDAELVDAARRINVAVWVLWFPTLLVQAFPASMAWFTLVPLAMVLFFWAWVMILFFRGVFELWLHVRWAGALAGQMHDRSARMDATRRAMEEAVQATIRPAPPGGGDVTLDR